MRKTAILKIHIDLVCQSRGIYQQCGFVRKKTKPYWNVHRLVDDFAIGFWGYCNWNLCGLLKNFCRNWSVSCLSIPSSSRNANQEPRLKLTNKNHTHWWATLLGLRNDATKGVIQIHLTVSKNKRLRLLQQGKVFYAHPRICPPHCKPAAKMAVEASLWEGTPKKMLSPV